MFDMFDLPCEELIYFGAISIYLVMLYIGWHLNGR